MKHRSGCPSGDFGPCDCPPKRVEHIAEGVTLYLGDCREIVPTLGKFDAVVTDPPYGISFAAQPTKWQRRAGQQAESWDNLTVDGISGVISCAPTQVVWGGNYYALPPSRGWLTWFKPDAPPSMGSVEFAWTNQDRNARQISHTIAATRDSEGYGHHPTQKPVEVMKWTLEHFPKCKTIIDPFMGSGTTGIAAVKLGRKFTGIEIEPKYFDIAIKRIQAALDAPDLFVDAPKPAKQEAFEL
jgi:site-specific DNA-methyltransferase (adenine-specific)